MHSNDVPESKTDVLIIGAGPAGLSAAYWMAQYGVNARIIDKRGTKIFNGQADGLRARSLELFDSMGFLPRVTLESKTGTELRLWNSDGKGGLHKSGSIKWGKEAYSKSRFAIVGLNQGRIERFMLDAIKEAKPDLEVERGIMAETLECDETLAADPDAYPITVKLRTLSEDEANPSPAYGSSGVRDGLFRSNLSPDDWEDLINKSKARAGTTEVVKAKYIIGCDGAHSWTRKQLGIKMEGAATDFIWGVMDVVPISNFPDMRHACTIKSDAGTILLICRERGLMRLYISLSSFDDPSRHVDRSTINLDVLKATAQKILHPYKFDFKICDWWSAYQVGQRVASGMSDPTNRIFISGDACHTHSPKVGAGMNISIQDGFNIGWKVASVAAGLSPASILPTYALERHPIAERLAEFDRHWSRLFLPDDKRRKLAEEEEEPAAAIAALAEEEEDGDGEGRAAPKPSSASSASDAAFAAANARFEDFAQGFKLDYPPSILVARSGATKAAGTRLMPGERFWPAKLTSQTDGCGMWTTGIMRSDGRWRVVVLAGDVVGVPGQMARVTALCDRLLQGNLKAMTMAGGKKFGGHAGGLVDVMAVHCGVRDAVELFDFPEALRPVDAERGVDYYKIWVDERSETDGDRDGEAYAKWGVDRARGAVLVMRPDQCIGWYGDLEDVEEMESYLEGVLKPAL
ncbi:hypothetical protein SLS58_004473 [Diplodia intermedia]|uniref:Phenol 2-monooxygenase n=1 Tax=Diplodia intermedia TaxID=856260 RepID=A0ABR3TU44_9PEZI